MQIEDAGVLSSSKMLVHIPTEFARKNLFFVPITGKFECTPVYRVNRTSFEDSFLLLYVKSGQMEAGFRAETKKLRADDVLLLDCREPHSYRALENTKFQYFHFAGNCSEAYFNLLYDRYGMVIHSAHQASLLAVMNEILRITESNQYAEDRVSVNVHLALSLLCETPVESNPGESAISLATQYIGLHYTEPLTVHEVAERFNISEYYFIRLFREYNGLTPYQYINRLRITLSRQLLASTSRTVEQIAYHCGYSSSQLFIRAFKRLCGCTPNEYRRGGK